MSILMFLLCVVAACLALVLVPLWLDRVIVFLMRALHIYIFPIAIRMAFSLESAPDEWHLDMDEVQHPIIGKIRFNLRDPWMIRVDLPDTNQACKQRWKPNFIERRIISNAVDGLVIARRMTNLDRTLPRLPL